MKKHAFIMGILLVLGGASLPASWAAKVDAPSENKDAAKPLKLWYDEEAPDSK